MIHCLETLPDADGCKMKAAAGPQNRFLIIDGMAVVQALMYAAMFKTCIELAAAFVRNIDVLLTNYEGGRIIFDNYSICQSIKSQI